MTNSHKVTTTTETSRWGDGACVQGDRLTEDERETLAVRLHVAMWGLNLPPGMTPRGVHEHTADRDKRAAQRQFIRHAIAYAEETGFSVARLSRDEATIKAEALRGRIEALADKFAAEGAARDAVGKPAWPNNVARDLRAALADETMIIKAEAHTDGLMCQAETRKECDNDHH